MRQATTIAFLFLATGLSGQTKPIAFKSHSGNMRHFTLDEQDNLGAIPIDFFMPDTLSFYPYWTDTTATKEQVQEFFPTYSNVMKSDSNARKSGLSDFNKAGESKKDTLTGKNQVHALVLTEPGTDVEKSTSLKRYFLFTLFTVLPLIGFLIWFTNRHKITPGS